MLDVGYGCIHNEKGEISYKGTLPKCKDLEPVCVVRQSDLELIMKAEEMILLRFPFEMEKELYGNRVIETKRGVRSIPPKLVDEMFYHAPDGTTHKLFLDHHFYSSNPRDCLFARWVNVDLSFLEEQP
jgi:hypothetical protein